MAYTTIDKPTDYFNTIIYTGDGSQDVTGVGFKPDWVWVKARGNTYNHQIHDSVRGATAGMLSSNQNIAEDTNYQFDSFDSDGFTTDSGNITGVNGSGHTQVAWNWLASGSTASNTDGSITSTVSANTTAGFSIVKYNGSGSAATVGHGLGNVPKMIIIKETSGNASGGNQAWSVYHHAMGNTHFIPLNTTEAKIDDVDFNDTTPTSSVFSVGVQNRTNSGNGNGVYIAYCFAEKKGYSKFGSYTGNGNADGAFIYTGFKPAWFLVKKSSGSGNYWMILDNKRNTFNVVDQQLYPNANDADTHSDTLDFVSNGFKIRYTGNNANTSGATFIYMAFAENPFVSSGGIPTTAR